MNDLSHTLLDPRLEQALRQVFNGTTLKKNVGDCTILTGIRKQTGSAVDIYSANYSNASDDAVSREMLKDFVTYESLNTENLQAPVRVWKEKAFKRTPVLAVLSCEIAVFDDAFETRGAEVKIDTFRQVLEGLADLHGAGLVHGALCAEAVRRETEEGAVRLCDLGFSGGRKTSVTGQPMVYQSRHVVTRSQPRPEDDVYSAGMVGYRIFLGRHGPESVLTGRAEHQDEERIAAAILGEDRPAPDGTAMFPETHPAADDIARLLARMTGRGGQASTYSNACSALNALRAILGMSSDRKVPEPAQKPAGAPSALEPDEASGAKPLGFNQVRRGSLGISAAAPSKRSAQVSPATAVALFVGAVAGLGAATHFYMRSDSLSRVQERSLAAIEVLQAEKGGLAQQVDDAMRAGGVLVAAKDVVTRAREQGAMTAGDGSLEAMVVAERTFGEAMSAFQDKSFDIAEAAGQGALESAERALADLETARTAALASRTRARELLAAAEFAGARDADTVAAAAVSVDAAARRYAEGNIAEAADAWAVVSSQLEAFIDAERAAAEVARRAAVAIRSDAAQAPRAEALILSDWLVRQGEDRFAAGAFSQAREAFERAQATLSAVPPSDGAARAITIGSSIDEMAEAVGICRTAGVSAPETCPTRRPASEAERAAEIRPFEMDAREVTLRDFERFIADTGFQRSVSVDPRLNAVIQGGVSVLPGVINANVEKNATDAQDMNLPVTQVSMNDAMAYCAWKGGRVPTEAEWEYAAGRQAEGAYPWGDWASDKAVWRGADDPVNRILREADPAATVPVDLSGNVREWVRAADGPVLKGGSWMTTNPADLRIAARVSQPAEAAGVDFGIRCAYDKETW